MRQTIVETMRSSTLAESEIDSLWPSCDSAELTISGEPPSSAMPAAKDTRVRVEVLSKNTATVCGPA